MMYSGYIVGLIILPTVIINGLIDLGGLNVMMYALLLPTVLSAYLGPPRPIRDVARLMLGISMMTFYAIIIVSIIDKAWWVAVLTLVVYFSLKRILMNKRENSNDEVCQTCPEVNKPRCSGMKEYHDRQMIIDGTVSRFDVFSE